MEDIPASVATFWAPVAGIVPTIAIALIIEARLRASNWDLGLRWIRWAQGILWYASALALVTVEIRALVSMMNPSTARTPHLGDLLLVVGPLVVVVLLPAVGLATRATAEGEARLGRYIRWLVNPEARRLSREIRDELHHHQETVRFLERLLDEEFPAIRRELKSAKQHASDDREREELREARHRYKLALKEHKIVLDRYRGHVETYKSFQRRISPKTKVAEYSHEEKEALLARIRGLWPQS